MCYLLAGIPGLAVNANQCTLFLMPFLCFYALFQWGIITNMNKLTLEEIDNLHNMCIVCLSCVFTLCLKISINMFSNNMCTSVKNKIFISKRGSTFRHKVNIQ